MSVCKDGAAFMARKKKDSWPKSNRKTLTCNSFIFFLHRKVLVAKTLLEELKQVIHISVKLVNFITAGPLKSRLFRNLKFFAKKWVQITLVCFSHGSALVVPC